MCAQISGNECTVFDDVQGRERGEPHVSVDACPFIEPAFFHCGVDPHGDNVVAAVIEVIGNIIAETPVAALLGAEIEAVDPDDGIAEDAVELDEYALAQIRPRNGEAPAVPSHAVFRKRAAHRSVPVAEAAAFVKRKLDTPVMGEVQFPPAAVVEPC